MVNGADDELVSDNQGNPSDEEIEESIVEDTVTLTTRASNNKLFQARVLLEKDKEVYGAEIILYDKNAEEINRILITDETKYETFNKKVDMIGKAYVPFAYHDVEIVETLSETTEGSDEYVQADGEWSELSKKKDLKTILENKISLTDPSTDIVGYTDLGYSIINATHLNGLVSGDFSKVGHHHDGRYLDSNHSTAIGINGKLGHLRLVDNLTTSEINGGQVLSANQGRELNNRLKKLESRFQWKKVKNWDGNNHVNYRVNEDLKLCVVDYTWNEYTGFKKDPSTNVLHKKAFPYKPTQRCVSSLYRGDVAMWINKAGEFRIRSLSKFDKLNINAQFIFFYK